MFVSFVLAVHQNVAFPTLVVNTEQVFEKLAMQHWQSGGLADGRLDMKKYLRD